MWPEKMPVLVEYRSDGSARQSWNLEKDSSIVIGRNPDQAAIVIPHASVSRRHAVLKLLSGRRWRVADLGAVNGTYVDDALTRTEVEGDVDGGESLRFGENGYEYKIETVPPPTSNSGSDDELSRRNQQCPGNALRKHRQDDKCDELSRSSGSPSPSRLGDSRRGGARDRARDRGRYRSREREPSRDREMTRCRDSRADSDERTRERERERRRGKERKRGKSRSKSRSRSLSRERKGRRRSKWDEGKPKSLFSDQPSPEELERQKALLAQLAIQQQQKRRVIPPLITPSCILEPPPGVTTVDDSKPKLSVQEKRKLLWGKKDGGAASSAEAPEVSSKDSCNQGPPAVTTSEDPNNYARSFTSDKGKQSKFLKLLGYKGDLKGQEDDRQDETVACKQPRDDDQEIKKRENLLESQYLSSVLRADGRKTGLGS